MTAPIALRPVSAADEPFLRGLYVDAHPEFAHLPAAAFDQLVDLQIAAQRAQYVAAYPDATDQVVELDGVPVGRCWTDLSPSTLRVLDLAVAADHRRRGIGRAVLGRLTAWADEEGVVVRLSVWSANLAARRLYASTGFVPDGEANGYLHLSRARGAGPRAQHDDGADRHAVPPQRIERAS